MQRVPQPAEELQRQLDEQLTFLRAHCESYDKGLTAFAKEMAGKVRLLARDTGRSKALLGQLGLKQSLLFADGGEPPGSKNAVSVSGLCHLRLIVTNGVPAWSYAPQFGKKLRWVSFDEWWERPVIRKPPMSREHLVLNLAETDGGVHVDPDLDPDYDLLSRRNAGGWTVHTTNEKPSDLTGIELASMRQIAWELLHTLQERRRSDAKVNSRRTTELGNS